MFSEKQLRISKAWLWFTDDAFNFTPSLKWDT